VATPAIPNIKASRLHRPGRTPGLSSSGAALGVIAAGIWVAVGVGILLHDDRARLGGTLAIAIACGIGFLAIAARDTQSVRQWKALYTLGRRVERLQARTRPEGDSPR
jgi:hypothetical protein